MIDYKGCLNLGNAALGTERTITANEDIKTADIKALAHHIHMHNQLIPEQVAESVLENFGTAAVELMGMGFAIQFKKNDDVLLRIFPDIHVKGGNINLARAKELDPTVTELTKENAGRLIDLAGGVTVRVHATAMNKFTEMLTKGEWQVQRTGIEEKAYVERKNGAGGDDNENQGGDNGGSNGGENEE